MYNFIKNHKEPFLILFPCLFGTFGMLLSMFFLSYKSLVIGKEWLFKSLIYGTLIRFLNIEIFPIDKVSSNLFSYVLLIIVFIKSCHYLITREDIKAKENYLLGIYCFFIFFFSYLKSEWLLLSSMKLLIFAIGFISVMTSIYATKNYNWLLFIRQIYKIIILLILISIPLGGISFYRGGGLKGIFNHSQSAGVIISIFWVGYLACMYEHNFKKRLDWLFLIIGLFELFLTQTRTAVASIILGILISTILYDIKKPLSSLSKLIRFIFTPNGLLSVFFVFAITVLFSAQISLNFNSFVFKRLTISEQKTSSSYDLLYSRRILYEKQIKNFDENQWLGIGFGMPTEFNADEDHFGVAYIPGTLIPISYPIEKGVLVTALLEETGIIGFSLFILFIISLSVKFFYKNRYFILSILFFSALAINMGESIFFATNGLGILVWSSFAISRIYLDRKMVLN